MTPGEVRGRLASGAWERVTIGTYRLLPAGDDIDSVRGAIAALPDAVASHGSAAALHGIEGVPSAAVVTVPARTTHVFPGVRVVRTNDLVASHLIIKSGIETTTVERTLVDLAADLRETQLRRVVDAAIAARLTTPTSLAAVHRQVARRGKRGTVRMRSIVGALVPADIPPSVFEARFRRLLDSANLVEYEVEYPIPWSSDERFDIAFPADALAVELDSYTWHSSRSAFENDRRRDREAALHGWRVLRYTWGELSNAPSSIIATLRQALSVRSA